MDANQPPGPEPPIRLRGGREETQTNRLFGARIQPPFWLGGMGPFDLGVVPGGGDFVQWWSPPFVHQYNRLHQPGPLRRDITDHQLFHQGLNQGMDDPSRRGTSVAPSGIRPQGGPSQRGTDAIAHGGLGFAPLDWHPQTRATNNISSPSTRRSSQGGNTDEEINSWVRGSIGTPSGAGATDGISSGAESNKETKEKRQETRSNDKGEDEHGRKPTSVQNPGPTDPVAVHVPTSVVYVTQQQNTNTVPPEERKDENDEGPKCASHKCENPRADDPTAHRFPKEVEERLVQETDDDEGVEEGGSGNLQNGSNDDERRDSSQKAKKARIGGRWGGQEDSSRESYKKHGGDSLNGSSRHEDAELAEAGGIVEGKNVPNLICRFCGRRFVHSRALGGHMNTHRRERQGERLCSWREMLGSELCFANSAAGRAGLGRLPELLMTLTVEQQAVLIVTLVQEQQGVQSPGLLERLLKSQLEAVHQSQQARPFKLPAGAPAVGTQPVPLVQPPADIQPRRLYLPGAGGQEGGWFLLRPIDQGVPGTTVAVSPGTGAVMSEVSTGAGAPTVAQAS